MSFLNKLTRNFCFFLSYKLEKLISTQGNFMYPLLPPCPQAKKRVFTYKTNSEGICCGSRLFSPSVKILNPVGYAHSTLEKPEAQQNKGKQFSIALRLISLTYRSGVYKVTQDNRVIFFSPTVFTSHVKGVGVYLCSHIHKRSEKKPLIGSFYRQ